MTMVLIVYERYAILEDNGSHPIYAFSLRNTEKLFNRP